MASSRRVLLRLQSDTGDARRGIADVRSDLRRMSRDEARVRLDINTARVERQIEVVQRRLAELAQQTPSPTVDLRTTRAQEQLALLELRLAKLGRKKIAIDVDIRRGGVERTAAVLGSVERGVGSVVNGIGDALRAIPIFGQVFATALNGAISLASTLGQALGSLVTTGLESLGNTFKSLTGLGALAGPIGAITASLVGMVAQFALLAAIGGGVVIALNAVLGAVVALGGALVALVASLTAAVAGLGALAVAFGAVLIPVLVVAVGLFTRFAAILKARQAREQELTQSVQAQRTAERQRRDALDASRAAHNQLRDAVVAGRNAMAQAARDEKDAELGLESSRLGVREARLGLAKARADLREFLAAQGAAGPTLNALTKKFTNVDFDPSRAGAALGDVTGKKTKDPLELQSKILAVQRAQLGVKESINATTNAESRLAAATKKRADFAKRGLEAYKPYRTALEAVRRSEIRLQRAQNTASAASDKYKRALKDLSATEQTSLSNLNKFIAGFKRLAKAFTDPIFRAANDVFGLLSGKAGFLEGALKKVGEAMGGAIRAFGAFLAQPQTISAFKTMAAGAAELVRTLGAKAFISFLTILREIAVTALPAVRHAASDVANALARIAGQPGKIHSATQGVISQFRAWARLAGSVLALVAQIFVPASRAGANLADSMRHVVDKWREWVHDNPREVVAFFRTAVRRTVAIFNGIKSIAKWLKNDLPKAAEKSKKVFGAIYNVIKKIIDLTDKVKQLARDAADLLGVGQSPTDAVNQAKNDLGIINRDQARLKEHLDPNTRSAIRKELIEAIRDVLSLDKQTNVVNLTGEKSLQGLLNNLLRAQQRPIRTQAQERRSPDARTSRAPTVNAHISVSGGGPPDPRVLAARLERELRLAG